MLLEDVTCPPGGLRLSQPQHTRFSSANHSAGPYHSCASLVFTHQLLFRLRFAEFTPELSERDTIDVLFYETRLIIFSEHKDDLYMCHAWVIRCLFILKFNCKLSHISTLLKNSQTVFLLTESLTLQSV